MTAPRQWNLAQALQRGFVEAGEPSIAAVAAGAQVSRQRLSDWRSGRHVPAQYDDVEPVIRYLRLLADTTPPERDTPRVAAWTPEQWRHAWHQSTTSGSAGSSDVPGDGDSTAAGPQHTDAATGTPAVPDVPPKTVTATTPPTANRRAVALAITLLLCGLVAALAIAVFLLSYTT